ncbi:Mu-like prophage protein gp29 [Tistlia consotensis]|uniref:Mu-like prophage protein gp29 n=1 Tax=Tistlia consotensis USBA 355 TaxID=560819 RepID=A0A1Y6CZJ9_9PROT|nr:DUF935 domain-containing protein [Tistlia consotensis]SMF85343.1 Mu-like prophage protein gp29 [Tistlia consotensis USBA 355]SNS37934.1 Mu-like prophage protein gp29 [Tistlia consotensis]
MVGLVDQYGRPLKIDRRALRREEATPTLAGVRSILADHPSAGLTPQRLAQILREAEAGDATRQLELAEDMEEKDLHYLGVLGTRKRAIAQLDITVEAASDAKPDQEDADLIREWLARDELEDELFDVLDGIGKGYSATEIVWDLVDGQRWLPSRLEWRDPRWFEIDRTDGRTLLLRSDSGPQPLTPFKYIVHVHKAKSGLPIRGGLARIAAWSWMFKSFASKDWAIFCETYGQPLRLGRYGPETTEADRQVLYDAVANIASDCAAIIPKGMEVEFVKAEGAATNAQLYQARCDWLDQQVSKAVLGQTTTTDAIAGGHAVSQEHREVQKDIERSDARQLAATLNRQLVRPIIDLTRGPQRAYPRIVIGRADTVDVTVMSGALEKLVPLGLKVQMSEVRDKLGFADPEKDAELLAPPAATPAPPAAEPPALATQAATPPARPAPQQQPAPERLAERLDAEAAGLLGGLVEEIRKVVEGTGDLAELQQRLLEIQPDMPLDELADIMARAMAAADLAGRAGVIDG